MRIPLTLRYALSFLLLSAVSAPGWSAGLSLYTENFKPYQYVDESGNVSGFGVELVSAIFEEAGVEIENKVRMGVWDRVYETALNDVNAGVFMTVRNKKREDLFKWVGPLAPRKMWLYKLRQREDVTLKTLEDAKAYLVGSYKSAQSDYLVELGFPMLDIVAKEALNFEKLLAGRIDLTPSLEIMMISKLRDKGIPLDTVERTVVLDHRFDYFLALNKAVSDEIVTKLQMALQELINNGRYQQIEHKYLSDLKAKSF